MMRLKRTLGKILVLVIGNNVYFDHEQSRSRLLLIPATGADVLEHISVVTTLSLAV